MSVRRFTLPAAMLTAVLMAGLTACGASDDDAKSTTPAANAPQNAPTGAGDASATTSPDAGHGSGHDPGTSGHPPAPADQAKDSGAAEPADGDAAFFVANLT